MIRCPHTYGLKCLRRITEDKNVETKEWDWRSLSTNYKNKESAAASWRWRQQSELDRRERDVAYARTLSTEKKKDIEFLKK